MAAQPPHSGHGPWNWRDAGRQALAFAILAGLLVLMFQVTRGNLQARGVHSGFEFLWKPAATPVHSSPLAFEAGVDTYARAFAAGALNSLKITLAAIAAATVLGVIVGLGRLSRNALARSLCAGYVEIMRNVPVLLHIVFWYGLVLELPAAAEATGGLFLATNRGIHLAWLEGDVNWAWSLGLLAIFLAGSRFAAARRAQAAVVTALPRWRWIVLVLLVGAPWLLAQRLPGLELPAVDGLEITGGLSMTPEFLALFLGISLYTAAFVAEIVRAAVGAVDRGQWEATSALGLARGATLRHVVLPQALRVGLPPLSSEYMGIFKNSTLAVAVGYQEFMAISETMLTDTGQAVEIMAIVMLFYAVVSLLVSAVMHAFERRNMRWGLR